VPVFLSRSFRHSTLYVRKDSGTLATALGGFGRAVAIFAPIYLIGIIAVLFLPETKGDPLPE
jgi:hypothetical protein